MNLPNWPMPCPPTNGESCAAEGRKAGLHLALALQDPTHKSLDLRIRRNCLPLSFRVKDGDASRVILGAGGAEQLPPRQFLTVMDQLLRGVAFAPSDEEIRSFLAAGRLRPTLPHRGWRRMLYRQRPRANKKMKSNNKFALYWVKDGRCGLCSGNCLAIPAARLMRQLRPFTAK
jgi:hypothetical protein